jgi:hypothetical protein
LNRVKSAWQSLFPGSTKFTGKTPREQETLLAVAESAKNKRATGWARVPRQLRWRGVPGALAMLGIADVVEGDAFWNGNLEPGSPLQIWWSGIRRPYAGGHSAVLETYIRDKAGRVTGFVYSDQWVDYRVVRRPSKGGILNPYIVGAKLRKKLRP